jgi:hypothetical protein
LPGHNKIKTWRVMDAILKNEFNETKGTALELQEHLEEDLGYDTRLAESITKSLGFLSAPFKTYLEAYHRGESLGYMMSRFITSDEFVDIRRVPGELPEGSFRLIEMNQMIRESVDEDLPFAFYQHTLVRTLSFPHTYLYDFFSEALKRIPWDKESHALEAVQSRYGNKYRSLSCINSAAISAVKMFFDKSGMPHIDEQVERMFQYYLYADIFQTIDLYFTEREDTEYGVVIHPFKAHKRYDWHRFLLCLNRTSLPHIRCILTKAGVNDFMQLYEGVDEVFSGYKMSKDGVIFSGEFKNWNDYLASTRPLN